MCVYGIGTFGCEYKFSPISDWGRVCKISQIVYRVDYRTHVKFSKFSIWVPHDNPPSKQFAKICILVGSNPVHTCKIGKLCYLAVSNMRKFRKKISSYMNLRVCMYIFDKFILPDKQFEKFYRHTQPRQKMGEIYVCVRDSNLWV
jgi:hypothetical protein